MMGKYITEDPEQLSRFLAGKPACAVVLFDHFIGEFKKIGAITVQPGKTMIGIAVPHKKIAYVSQLGKNFIHVVLPSGSLIMKIYVFRRSSNGLVTMFVIPITSGCFIPKM
jgi:hypothetical protein